MTKERETAYERLKDRLTTISDLNSANGLLFWDRQTYMPEEALRAGPSRWRL